MSWSVQVVEQFDLADGGQHRLRNTKPTQFTVADQLEELGFVIDGRRSGGLGGSFAHQDLKRRGVRMDGYALVPCPGHGLVVVVHLQQHVDVTLFGVQHDGPVGAIDASGAQVGSLERADLFVVDRRGGGFSTAGNGESGAGTHTAALPTPRRRWGYAWRVS